MTLKEFNLESKVAIITGGGRGIGKGIALALAEAGADIVVVDRTESDMNQAASEVSQLGRKCLPVHADVTKPSDVQNMVDRTISEFGKIDILVNNAGTAFIFRPLVALPKLRFKQCTEEEWRALIDLNLNAAYLCCVAVGPHMISQNKGKIINVSSTFATRGFNYNIPYTTTKAAIRRFTQSLAVEWARYNINVNCIGPGLIHTPLTDPLFQREEVLAGEMSHIPMGRTGEPRDIGLLAVYLASEASDYMTGQNIYVDGGITVSP